MSIYSTFCSEAPGPEVSEVDSAPRSRSPINASKLAVAVVLRGRAVMPHGRDAAGPQCRGLERCHELLQANVQLDVAPPRSRRPRCGAGTR